MFTNISISRTVCRSTPLIQFCLTFSESNVRQSLLHTQPLTVCVISLKTDTHLNYVQIFTTFVMENTIQDNRKNQLINGLHGNNPEFIVSYETYKLNGQVEGWHDITSVGRPTGVLIPLDLDSFSDATSSKDLKAATLVLWV